MKKAFTLIEMMVVITIISILAAVAMPNYMVFILRAQVVESYELINDLKPYVKEYYQHQGTFPANNRAAGLPEPGKLIGNYVTSVELENGAFHLTLGNRVNQQLQGKVLTIRPAVAEGSPNSPYAWISGYAEPAPGMQAVGTNKTTVDPQNLPYTSRSTQP